MTEEAQNGSNINWCHLTYSDQVPSNSVQQAQQTFPRRQCQQTFPRRQCQQLRSERTPRL